MLTAAFDLPKAMTLLLAPSLVTNLYRACVGGHAGLNLRRTWPFLVVAATTIWLGASALTRVDLDLLTALLGVLLVASGGLNLAEVRLAKSAERAVWMGPAFGVANGVLTGMTGSFVVPRVMFLQAIGLPRDALIQAMGILFTVSTLGLAVALGVNAFATRELGMLSVLAVAPALVGMVAGQMLRRRLSEGHFRRVFFAAIVVLGAYIIGGALL